jgi:shikimate dehydrogenase
MPAKSLSRSAFVIGHPIAHSRSPLIHGFWLRQHHIAATYRAYDVLPPSLGSFFDRMRQGEFVGGNVTLPHKQIALGLCDRLSPSATQIGAVNTLYLEGGQIVGSNSDHFGFVDNLDQQNPGWDHNPGTAIILGAGGAARAIVYALSRRGAKKIVILNRTLKNATALAAEVGDMAQADRLDAFSTYAPGASLLVNTSSVGLNGTRFKDLPLAQLPPITLVNDIVYTPLQTPLLADARALGLRTVDGLGMLLHQAIPGFERWFGVRPEVTPELRQMVERHIAGA